MATGLAFSRASSSLPRPHKRAYLTGALGVSALALAISLPTLARQSLWLDEAYTEHLVHLSLGGMLSQIPHTESTPPLYYLLAWIWTHVFGYSAFGLRSLSALAGAVTAALGYAVAVRLGGLRAGLITGVLLAVSPIMVWYAQEGRAYALAAALSTATVLCLIRYGDSADRRWLAAWAVTAGLGLCTHYFVGFVVLVELVWLVRAAPDRAAPDRAAPARAEVRLAAALVILVALALLPLALAQQGTGHADYIAQGVLGTRLLQVPKQFLIGYASPGQAVTAPVAALLVLVGALVPLFLARASVDRAVALPLTAGAVVVVVPSALALVGIDFVDTRNMLVALPLLLIVLGVGFAGQPRVAGAGHRSAEASSPSRVWPTALAVALAVLCAVVLALVETHVEDQRTDWRGAAHALGAAAGPRALVVTPGTALLPLGLYMTHLAELPPDGSRVQEVDIVAMALVERSGGQGAPPHPSATPTAPLGFALVSASYQRGLSVLRYRAARPLTVSPASLTASALGGGGAATLVQR